VFALGIALSCTAFAETHHVVIENMKFNPQTVQVHVGDTIVWENRDIVPHTVTENSKGKTHAFDSGMIQGNATYQLKVTRKGTQHYACSYHPTMAGTIQVKGRE
jgi:plastocyanin